MALSELQQRFPDGTVLIVGTTKFDETYYNLGEEKNIGDLAWLSVAFSRLRIMGSVSMDYTLTQHTKSYLRILRMIATKTDNKYPIASRTAVAKMLRPHQETIEVALNSGVITEEQIKTLLPLSNEWNKFSRRKMESK